MPKRKSCGSVLRSELPPLVPMPSSNRPTASLVHTACRSPDRKRVRRGHQNLCSARCQPVPNTPRLRALALFGRRPPQRVDRPSIRQPKTCTTAEVGWPIDHLFGPPENWCTLTGGRIGTMPKFPISAAARPPARRLICGRSALIV
jgi:hypothetical protein